MGLTRVQVLFGKVDMVTGRFQAAEGNHGGGRKGRGMGVW